MAKYKIQEIGKANFQISKKGNRTIKLMFNRGVFSKIAEHDFENGIYIMTADGKIIAPMPYEL